MKLLKRLRFWLQQLRVERELAEEMRIHREMLEEQIGREGARRRFGNATAALEQSRDQWSFVWLDSVLQDIRYAGRALHRSKTFAATAVLTLGVGLGLNTVLFTVFNAYVLRPFAVRDPDSLYEIGWSGKNAFSKWFSHREYQDVRERRDIFSDAVATTWCFIAVGPHHLAGEAVSGNYFRMLGADTLMGRPLLEDDAVQPGASPVAVISHQAWKIVFGQDPQVLGKKVFLNGHPFEVIGVTRPEFTGLEERPPDFWVPLTMLREIRAGEDLFGPAQPKYLVVVGRLRPDVTPARAAATLGAFMERNATALGDAPENVRSYLKPRNTAVPYSIEMMKFFSPVLAAFILVLIAACANVSNMMLARATTRQREIGVRLSLGASRGRLIRQLLTEGLLIALLAGITGMAIARATIDLGLKLFFATAPSEFAKIVRLVPIELDHRVFFFALAAATAATLLFGLLPSLQATRLALVSALRGEFGRFRASRLRDALVISQVTVCLVLIICAATLFRNTDVFRKHDLGMRVDGVIHVGAEDPKIRPLAGARLAAEPGTEIVAVFRAPLYGRLREIAVTPSGASELMLAGYNFVSPEYFRLLGIPIRRGRNFAMDEARSEASSVIISEATARRFWPGEEAVGKTIRVESIERRWVEKLPGYSEVRVIGIAKDVTNMVLDGVDRTCIYFPTSLSGKHANNFLVRSASAGSPSRLRAILSAQWPEAAFGIVPLDQVLTVQIYPFQAATWIGWLLGMVALVLTISGMYGVMTYLVSQRTKEVGIRIALGASPAMILRLVMRHSMKLTGMGLFVGLAISIGAVKLLFYRVLLFLPNIVIWDAAAVLLGVALVTVAALVAAYFPSRRASRLDPISTLRFD